VQYLLKRNRELLKETLAVQAHRKTVSPRPRLLPGLFCCVPGMCISYRVEVPKALYSREP
jgi:hypothetical protein